MYQQINVQSEGIFHVFVYSIFNLFLGATTGIRQGNYNSLQTKLLC